MAASSSTSANLNINSEYDVFINHRGPDVKKTFASHLYRALRSFGLNVFLDQQELQKGDCIDLQIKEAIRTASVHVAIFSKRYAESSWCLKELLLMLESNAHIIPVFYQVKPAELRWTHGQDRVYAQALRELEEKSRYSSTDIENWRKALSRVAEISGFELEACNDDEGELKDQVVECVLRKVKKTPLNVAEYPTGLDEKVTDFENEVLLQHRQSGRKPQVVGIVGLGGAGKTTLAKELYNRKRSDYNRVCILSDVRETVGKGSLTLLQSKLMKCFTGSDLRIDNKDEAIEKLKKHFSSSPILLILDDVDSVDQVGELVPNQTSIHSNSLVLITSRSEDVLKNSGVEKSSIYKLKGLNQQHSLELFCWHAFNQPSPRPEFRSLAYQFLETCHGLPLSLKVLGALLRGNEDSHYWNEQLDRLQDMLPSEIQERLLISYKALNTQEKNIFLDISCFFIGEDRDKAITIWNGSGWKGWLGFRSLETKCLVEVDKCNQIQMHDHLKEMGRDIAKGLSPHRLWRWTNEVIDNLLGQPSAIIVRGIRIYNDNDDVFSDIRMMRLQLLDSKGDLLDHIMTRVKHSNLIWLRWSECPYSSLPSGIPLKNLRVLEVSESRKLETLWVENSQLPECLEELRIKNCDKLKSIPGLQQLTRLRVLSIEFCPVETLVSLPGCLEELRIGHCDKLKSIPGLQQLTRLRVLIIEMCPVETLVSLPECLEELQIWACHNLKSIPGLQQITRLRVLIIVFCPIETLVSLPECLEELRIELCNELKSIPGLAQATKLRDLDISGCYELEELPSVETLTSLQKLRVEDYVNLKSIRGVGGDRGYSPKYFWLL